MEDNLTIFVLEFGKGGYDQDTGEECRYHVWSNNDSDILAFVKQHNFDLNSLHVDTYDTLPDEIDEDDMLLTYRFKSNKYKDEIFNIKTSYKIISDLIVDVTNSLIDTLQLGKICNREDIEFIDIITTCVATLPHALPLSYKGGIDMDDNTNDDNEYYDDNINNYIETEDYIYQTLEPSPAYTLNGYIMDITIEAYISKFTDMMIDTKYNKNKRS